MSNTLDTTSFSRASSCDKPLYDRVLRYLGDVIENDFSHGERFFTERDLVKTLGVSQCTIRRALAELVEQKRLYRHVGRGTFVQKFKQTRLLGVILPQGQSPFLMQQLNGFAGLCDEFNCNLRVHHTRKGGDIREMARSLKADPNEERIVFLGHTHETAWILFDELSRRGFSTVCAVPFPQNYPGNRASIDADFGARLSLEHLLQLGHRRIAIILNEPASLANVQIRLEALKDEVAKRNLTEVVFHNCETQHWSDSYEAAFAAMPSVMASSPRPTAVMPISGVGAWAAARYAAQMRISVPEDLSIFCFDDIPGSALLHPPLTSLAADHDALARKVLEILWSDSDEERHEIVAPSIRVRESTARPFQA